MTTKKTIKPVVKPNQAQPKAEAVKAPETEAAKAPETEAAKAPETEAAKAPEPEATKAPEPEAEAENAIQDEKPESKYPASIEKRAKEVFESHEVEEIFFTSDESCFTLQQYAVMHSQNLKDQDILTVKRSEV